MILHNLLVYNLQICILVAACGLTMALLKIRSPKARLYSLQGLLALIVLLPFLQPRIPVIARVTAVTTDAFAIGGHAPVQDQWSLPSWTTICTVVLVAGVILRLTWLALGMLRLSRLRGQASCLPGAHQHLCDRFGVVASFYLSNDVSGPVTFGYLRPAILLPFSHAANDFAVCHELLHIRRRDWPVAFAEQIFLSLFWFNPAIWWLVGRLQLTREQVVDQEVVTVLENRDGYLGTLLALASSRQTQNLAPANLFFQKRHLRQRVAALLQEVSMTRIRLFSSAVALSAMAALAVFLCVRALPLQAEQMQDSGYLEVRTPNAKLLHRTAVTYPEAAREKQVQGEVTAELTLDAQGEVSDARIISGPEELRGAVLQSVLGWHFDRSASPASFQVAVDFKILPPNEGLHLSLWPTDVPATQSLTVSTLDVKVPPALAERVNSALTIHQGQSITPADVSGLSAALRQVDEHLQVNIMHTRDNSAIVRISVPGYGNMRIRVGGNVQQTNLIHKVTPAYPPDAKEARIQGTVKLEALIGKDGQVESLKLISGHPLLVPSAEDAVQQWVYRPTLLNGDPVDVVTTIDVNYTLKQ